MADNFETDFDDNFDSELGDLGFDDFAESPPPKNAREAISSSLKKTSRGFKDEITNIDLDVAADIAKSAIPTKLSKEAGNVANISNAYKNEMINSGKVLKKEGRRFLNTMDRYIPKDSKLNSVLNKMKSFVGDEESSGPTPDQIRNQNVLNNVTALLGEQKTKDDYKQLLNQTLQHKKDVSALALSANIANNTEQSYMFQKEISNAYYRKSLELQYKSLYIAKDQLEVTKAIGDTFKNQLETIVRNTALPDIIKARSTETLKAIAKDQAFRKTMSKMFGEKSWVDNLKDKGTGLIKRSTTSILEGMTTVNDMSDSSAEMGEMAELAGGKEVLMGSELGSYIRNKISRTLSNKLASTEKGGAIVGDIKEAFLDPSEYFKDKAENSTGAKGSLFKTISNLTRNNPNEERVLEFGKDMNEASLFDNRVHTSITQVIPGLLSKIHAEIAHMRTGQKQDAVSYNYDTKQFLTGKEHAKAVRSNVATNLSRSGVTDAIKYAINIIEEGSSTKFSSIERESISKAMITYLLAGKSTNPSTLIKNGIFSVLPDEIKQKASKALTTALTKGTDEEKYKRLSYLNDYLLRARQSIPSSKEIINELIDSGNAEVMDTMGIGTFDKDTGIIRENRDGYKKLMADMLAKSGKGKYADLYKEELSSKESVVDDNIVKATQDAKAKAGETLRGMTTNVKSKAGGYFNQFKDSNIYKDTSGRINDFDNKHNISKTVKDKYNITKETLTNEYGDLKTMVNNYKANPELLKTDIQSKLSQLHNLSKEEFEEVKKTSYYKDLIKLKEDTDKKYGITGKINEATTNASSKYEEYRNKIDDWKNDPELLKVEAQATLDRIHTMSDSQLETFKKTKTYKDVMKVVDDLDVKHDISKKFNTAKNTVSKKASDAKSTFDHYNANREELKTDTMSKANSLYGKAKASGSNLRNKATDKFNSSLGILGGLGVAGMFANAKSSIGSKLNMFSKLKDKKESKNPFDRDGSGNRDGSWKDRLNMFKKDKNIDNKDIKESGIEKDKGGSGFGVLGMLAGAIPLITTLIGKMTGGLGSAVGLLTKMVPGILNIGSLLGRGMLPMLGKIAGGILTTLPAVFMKAIGGLGSALNMGKNVLSKRSKTKMATKTGVNIAKAGGKSIGKSLLKKIPIIGAIAGLGFGVSRMMDGDFLGAGGEVLSGLASTIPGLGTAASTAIDAGLLYRDINKTDTMQDDDMGDEAEKMPARTTYTGKVENNPNVTPSGLTTRSGPMAGIGNFGENLILGRGVRVDGLNPAFAEHLNRMANEYFSLTGKKIPINSGYRSKEDQMRLRRKYGKRAAMPGKSLHEFGLAFDTNSEVADELDKLGLLRKYGFTRPVGKEKWHIEASGTQFNIPGVKKDPNLATKMVRASVGKGGGGWALANNARKYSRNTDFQKKIFETSTVKTIDESKSNTNNISLKNMSSLNDVVFKTKTSNSSIDSDSVTKTVNKVVDPVMANAETSMKSTMAASARQGSDYNKDAVNKLSSIDNTLKETLQVSKEHLNTTKEMLALLGYGSSGTLSPEELQREKDRKKKENIQANGSDLPKPVLDLSRKRYG